MSQESSKNESKPNTPRQAAAQIVERLEEMILQVDEARENNQGTPPSERIMALISDATSLAEGISSGAITISQPRMALNLIEVVAELDKSGHHPLAAGFTRVIRWISATGIAADNCVLGRARVSQRHENEPPNR